MAQQDFMVKIGASMDVSQVEDAIKKLGTSLGQLKIDPKATTDLTKGLEKLKQQVETFKDKSKNVTDEKDMSELLTLAKGITRTYDSLIAKIKVMSSLSGEAAKKLFPPDTAAKIKAASKALEDYRDKIIAAEKSVTKQQDKIDNLNTRLQESAKAAGLTVDEFKNIEKAVEDARKEVEKYNEELEEAKKAPRASDGRTKEGRRVKELTGKRDAAQSRLEGLEGNSGAISKQAEEYAKKIADAEVRLRALQKAVADLNAAGGNKLKELTDSLKAITGLYLEGKNLEEIATALEEMGKTDLANLVTSLQQAGQTAGEAAPNMNKFAEETKDATEKTKQFDKQAGELSSLKSRIAYFFGAQNAINLFKKAIRSAFNSVKELDEIMTQTAVVTKFDVSDMWDQLPEYTERANALGVAISDAYKSATLFYQQGLKTNEVIEVSNQTLKMARIAGLDAADATDKMTAALRGFNMEVNGTNAERISDVYSKLAAITASNVQEISTAMTKTASLASNAGMQFETTAAFLSQIIETTRESAETAGTALKTVIARFQELKKSPDEIGEVDGEIIDANKIEGALRTVGVALRDASGQFRDLDQVFMELASKWDSLDTNTQRYIATIAAGSRQQSRFIAMMSDYKRTTELVEAANNAAGASTQQYEKTLESMQTVLNRLKNAWNEFTMGIANSSILKAALNVLTGIVNAINKLTKVLGSTAGGFAKLGIAVGGLRVGRKFVDAFALSFTKLKDKGVGPATAATKSFGAAFNSLLPHYKKSILQTADLNTNLGRLVKDYKEGVISNKKFKDGLDLLVKSGKVGEEQLLAYNTAVKAGISQKEASILLTNKEAAASVLAANGKKQEIKATIDQANANGIEQVSQLGLLQKMKLLLIATTGLTTKKRVAAMMTLKGATAEEVDAFMKQKQTRATIQATGAQYGFNTALLMCPIFWIVAGVAALVVGIVALVNHFKKLNSAAYKLEKVNKVVNELNDDIDEVKDGIKDIIDQREELDGLYNTFSHLAKGSAEWKQQLVEINTKILDLVTKYPELAQYLTRGKEGELRIDDKGWDVVIGNQQTELRSLLNTRLQAQAEAEMLRGQIETENVLEKSLKIKGTDAIASQTSYGGDASGLSTIEFNELIARIANAGLGAYSDASALKQVYDQYVLEKGNDATFGWDWNRTYNVIQKLGNDFELLSAKVQASGNAIDSYTETMISNLVDDSVSADSTLKDQLVNILSIENDQMMEDLKDEIEYANNHNRGKDSTGQTENDFLTEYKAITGKTGTDKSIIKEEGWDKINRTVLTHRKELEMQEKVTKLNQRLITAQGKEGSEGLLNLLTKGGAKLTKDQLNNLQSKLGSGSKEEIDKYLQDNFDMTFEDLGVSLEVFKKGLETASDSFVKAEQSLRDVGLYENIEGKISAEANTGLAQHIANLASAGGGSRVAQILKTQLNPILSSEDWKDGELETFATILNSMDWRNLDSWNNLLSTMEESGIQVTSELSDSITNFAKSASDAANAVEKLDFSTLEEQVLGLSNILKGLKTGEQGRIFDADAYNKLFANSGLKDAFRKNLDGNYVYIGSSLNALMNSITRDLTKQSTTGLDQLLTKQKASEVLQGRIDNNTIGSLSSEKAQGLLDQLIIALRSNGVNLNKLGIEGLGDETRAVFLSPDRVKDLLEKLQQVNFTEDDKKSLKIAQDSFFEAALSNNGVYNGIRANSLRNNLKTVGDNDRGIYVAQIKDYADALITQSSEAGINELLIGQYSSLVEKFKNKNGKLSNEELEELSKVEDAIADELGIVYANTQIQAYLEQLKNLREEYDKISDDQLKIIKANQALAKFGISATNVEEANDYVRLLYLITQGDENAYIELIKDMAISAGIENAKTLSNDDIELALNSNDAKWKGIRRNLVNNGLMAEGKVGDRTYARFLNGQELLSNAELAGVKDEWENPYDYLSNINEHINGLIRERTRLEKQYQRLVENGGATTEQITENLKDQLDIFEKQADAQLNKSTAIQDKIGKLMEENKEFSDLISYDPKTGVLTENYDKVDERFKNDPKSGEQFKKYVDDLTQLRDQNRDAVDELEDIYDSVNDLKNDVKEKYLSFEQKVYDALVYQYESEIEKLEEINNSVNDANSKLIDALQSNIDKMRQDRANEEAETDIEDKQRRLDYLMMDTSGANALEIIKLQDEIANAQESYTDSLVDQSIQQLQDQNQIAQEQREEQIELMRSQLEYSQKSGEIWGTVESLLDAALGSDGDEKSKLLTQQRLETLLKDEANWSGMSTAQKQIWETEFNTEQGIAAAYIRGEVGEKANEIEGKIEDAVVTIQESIPTTGSGESSGGGDTTSPDRKALLAGQSGNGTSGGAVGTGAIVAPSYYNEAREHFNNIKSSSDPLQAWKDAEKFAETYLTKEERTNLGNEMKGALLSGGFSSKEREYYQNVDKASKYIANNAGSALKQTDGTYVLTGPSGKTVTATVGSAIYSSDKYNTKAKECIDYANYYKWPTGTVIATNKGLGGIYVADNGGYILPFTTLNGTPVTKYSKVFKSGGYADFTGPAWLDGTPSHPEAVLSAADTERFIALIDTLRSLEADGAGSSGDNYFDINIEVGSVSGDYDVERMADKIKEIIVNDAAYRNVNSINLIQ